MMAITGKWDSPKEALHFQTAYLLGENFTFHAGYGVTDERLLAIGLESRFNFLGFANTVDFNYAPNPDVGTLKLAMKQGAARLGAQFAFDGIGERRIVSKPATRYELNAKLTANESMKLAFSPATRSSKLKLMHRLDARNRLNVELNYSGGGNGKRYFVVGMNHQLSKKHTLGISSNYGARKYSVELDYKTGGGPWTISTDFSYDKSPHIGDWHVKRRFEF